MDERVPAYGRYDHYKYYNMKKHIFRLNYEEKKRREAETQRVQPNYYENYFRHRLWQDSPPNREKPQK
tara:strand:- start:857 stop:1060 length:204 start_codon:yes stop_codon:yes gene_type:complete